MVKEEKKVRWKKSGQWQPGHGSWMTKYDRTWWINAKYIFEGNTRSILSCRIGMTLRNVALFNFVLEKNWIGWNSNLIYQCIEKASFQSVLLSSMTSINWSSFIALNHGISSSLISTHVLSNGCVRAMQLAACKTRDCVIGLVLLKPKENEWINKWSWFEASCYKIDSRVVHSPDGLTK